MVGACPHGKWSTLYESFFYRIISGLLWFGKPDVTLRYAYAPQPIVISGLFIDMKTNLPLRLTTGLIAVFAAISAHVSFAQETDRDMRTRDRQTYEVIVGDYYTGRSPYFKGNAPAPAPMAQAKPSVAPVPAPAIPCSIINSGLIHMSKTMPREAVIGEEFEYELKPMATGCAANVVVTDQIPDGATYVSSSPTATVAGNKLTWNLGNMDAGESKSLKVRLKPTREGTLFGCATVSADPRVCAQTIVGRPSLAIEKSGPEVAQLGADVSYTVTVKNNGTAIAKNVVVTDKVPAGLGGPKEIPYNVGDLAPGQSRTITVPLKAAERGRHCNVAVASSSNAGTVQDDACTLVVKPGLKLVKTGDAEMYINKQAKYKVTASNIGDTDLTGVVVTDTAPSQTRIVSAQGASVTGNTATWNVGTLKAGESKSFDVVLTTTQPGRWCNAATVNTAQGLRESAEACTLWKGIAAVLLEVVDDPDPVQVGESTTYTIRITNQGNADLININTVAQFPKEFTPTSASQGTVDSKTVKFPTVPRLASKQSVTYTISAKAVEVGDSRMKVILTEDQLSSPVVEEESSRAY